MFNITGLQDILNNFERFEAELKERMEEGLRAAGNKIVELSDENVPVDTGELIGSSYVEVSGNELEVGYTAEHAIYVHEDLEANHPNGGQAKFLEKAVYENKDVILDEVADEMKF